MALPSDTVVPDSVSNDTHIRTLVPQFSDDSLLSSPSPLPSTMAASTIPDDTDTSLHQPASRSKPRWTIVRHTARNSKSIPRASGSPVDINISLVLDGNNGTRRRRVNCPSLVLAHSNASISLQSFIPHRVLGHQRQHLDSDSENDADPNGADQRSSERLKLPFFAFKDRLKELDKQFEEEDRRGVALSAKIALNQSETINMTGPTVEASADPKSDVEPGLKHLFQTSPLTALEPSSPSSPVKKSNVQRAVATVQSSTERTSDDEESFSSAAPKRSQTHRIFKKRRVQDSDSEAEGDLPSRIPSPSKAKSPSSSRQGSPAKALKLFDSPDVKARKSPVSPPTSPRPHAAESDIEHTDEQPSPSRHGKRKARAPREKKRQKIKPLTKKQQRESVRETAKLLAERSVPVPEREEEPRLQTKDLFLKVAGSVPQFNIHRKSRTSGIRSEDPIHTSSPNSSQPRPVASGAQSEQDPFSPDLSFENPGFSTSMETAASASPVKTPPTTILSSRILSRKAGAPSFDFGDAGALGEPNPFDIGKGDKVAFPNGGEDEDEELPSLDAAVLRHQEEKRIAKEKVAEQERIRYLAAFKRRLVEQKAKAGQKAVVARASSVHAVDDDDDELEVEHNLPVGDFDSQQESLQVVERIKGKAKTTEKLRKAVLHDKLHPHRDDRSSPAKPPPCFIHGKKSTVPATDSQVVRAGQANTFGLSGPTLSPVKSGPVAPSSRMKIIPAVRQGALIQNLVQKIRHNDNEMRREKDKEWADRGGRKKPQPAAASQTDGLTKWVEKGLEVPTVSLGYGEEDEDDGGWNGEDGEAEEEYRGSTSPSPRRASAADPEGSEDEGSAVGEDQPLSPGSARPSSRAVSTPAPDDMDGEDKENEIGGDFLRRSSISSASNGETDKENEFEDKENVVPPVRRLATEDEEEDEEETSLALRGKKRKPLGRVIIDDEGENDENVPPVSSKRSSPSKDRNDTFGMVGFDDDDDEDDVFGAGRPTLMFGGKALFTAKDDAPSNFNLADAEAEMEGDGMTQLFALSDTKRTGFNALRKEVSLSMTLESQQLLPAMNISSTQQMRDDAIFGEDQEARAMLERKEMFGTAGPVGKTGVKQYVNEDGFLTQTKPADVELPEFSPSLFRPSASASRYRLSSQSPASALLSPPAEIHLQSKPRKDSFSDDEDKENDDEDKENDGEDEDKENQLVPPRRLIRRAALGSREGSPAATLVPPEPTNAFSALMSGAARQEAKEQRKKAKLEKSAFVEGEAEESDEEKVFGFGGGKADEEEDEDDADKVVEGLVDDNHMDVETVNAEKVLEKVVEQQAEDDAALEKLHQAAAAGELRGRKRDRGIGLDGEETDDDEDDDANRKRRRAMSKKRKVNAENIDALASNQRTVPFFNVYQQGIAADEDDELAMPASEGDVFGNLALDQEDEEDEYYDEEGDDEPEREVVSAAQIRKELLEAKRTNKTFLDPDDVSWVSTNVDEDYEELSLVVTEVPDGEKGPRRVLGQLEDLEAIREKFRAQGVSKAGSGKRKVNRAPREDSQRSATANASKGGSAITGRASKARAPSTAGSSSQTSRSAKSKLTKTRSLLNPITKKQSAFDTQ